MPIILWFLAAIGAVVVLGAAVIGILTAIAFLMDGDENDYHCTRT